MKNILIAAFWLIAIQINYSQTIHGIVNEKNATEGNPIVVGALARINGTSFTSFTDQDGRFSIPLSNDIKLPLQLNISFVGFKQQNLLITDTTNELKILLEKDNTLEEVVVETREKTTVIDLNSLQQVEHLGQKELLKAACCNLSESLSTNATVDVNYTDAVTGSKQISMLGLAGIYSQINWENMPLVRGIGHFYGLNFVPGTWIESIQIGKGSGSVVNGFESMTGQVNVEFKKPDNMDALFVNGYQNLQGRSELNAHASKHLTKEISTALFIHADKTSGERDGNQDGFLDRNNGKQLNLFNRWKYISKGNLRSQFGWRYTNDTKKGGQIQTIRNKVANPYLAHVSSQKTELFAKNGLIFPKKPYKSLGLIVNASNHNQNGYFGKNTLRLKQKSLYSNFIYQTIIGSTNHKIKTGANFQYDDLKTELNANDLNQVYSVPGVFTEYNFNSQERLQMNFGLRADYISSTKNVELSPRIHLKYITDDENTVRLSAGRGFRVPNVYADFPNLLASSRKVIQENNLQLESSWNYGISTTRYFKWRGHDGSFSADAFRTVFQNQIVRDVLTSEHEVRISNLNGTSFANSMQVTVDYELFDRFDIRLAGKYDDVKQTVNGELVEQVLTPKTRGLLNIAYAAPFNRWLFDITTHYTGKQRLPSTVMNPSTLRDAAYSNNFITLNAQATAKIKRWDFYVGGENLGNYKQKNPVLGYNSPFGNNFDASSIWAPIMGTNIYTGFRYTINKKK